MLSIRKLLEKLNNGDYREKFRTLYGKNNIENQRHRYIDLLISFMEYFEKDENTKVFLVSAPGRTEIGGNHTDHQKGAVLAASINLDAIAVVAINDSDFVRVKSEGYNEDRVDLSNLNVVKEDINSSKALVRGILDGIKKQQGKIGGFEAYTKNDVLKGSGLSSSAAFEVLLGNMINYGYNDGEISPIEIAKIGKYAENIHFLKPSGLLDQMASSVGGFVYIDFKDEEPIVKKIDYDFEKSGYTLCVVDTGGDHADLTKDYGLIPEEMEKIASWFGKKVLSEVDEKSFYENIKNLRVDCGDRAVLRGMHFFSESKRALKEAELLEKGDFEGFLEVLKQSGQSSFNYLQNISTYRDPKSQSVAIGLGITEFFLQGDGGYRVHGGGFAGTTLSFIPDERVKDYKKNIEEIFGADSFYNLFIRPEGGLKVIF